MNKIYKQKLKLPSYAQVFVVALGALSSVLPSAYAFGFYKTTLNLINPQAEVCHG